ncbi:unnamed protein product, partial [Closterium sp. NIES-54]
VLIVGDGDDNLSLKSVFALNETSRRAHVLSAATVQKPRVFSGRLALSYGG